MTPACAGSSCAATEADSKLVTLWTGGVRQQLGSGFGDLGDGPSGVVPANHVVPTHPSRRSWLC